MFIIIYQHDNEIIKIFNNNNQILNMHNSVKINNLLKKKSHFF